MGIPVEQRRYSVQEYYRIENDSSAKHEFRDGELLAMSGGSPQHSLIAVNIASELRNRLRGTKCSAFNSDLRVRIAGRQQTAYPDVSVICGNIEYDPDDPAGHTVLNPKLVVEVLSDSTEAYDRGDKFAAYRQAASFEEYVLVLHKRPRIETYYRQSDGRWTLAFYVDLKAAAKLQSIGVELPLAEVYAGIDFPDDATDNAGA